MSLLSDLKQKASTLSPASKFISISGIFYMACGLTLLVWPGIIQTVYKDPPFAGHEEALARLVGFLIGIIGWLYFFAGRSNSRQFIAATIVERLIFVPIVLVSTAIAGVIPHTLITFAVVDPILALITWYFHSKTKD
ncbi:MAG: hypothetical protein JSS30_02795 [Verrucomicrobia bacterium]|nr:hypothetical protein [Verrucomicrobiota bacterium]